MCVLRKGVNHEMIESTYFLTHENKLAKKEKAKVSLDQVNKSGVKCFFCKNKGVRNFGLLCLLTLDLIRCMQSS